MVSMLASLAAASLPLMPAPGQAGHWLCIGILNVSPCYANATV